MKQYYFLAVFVMALFWSCSPSDDSPTNDPPGSETNFFPSENGDFWVYDVQGDFPGRDSLFVANDTVINGKTNKKFKTKEVSFGFYSSSLAENGVRKSGDKLLVSGGTNINLIEGFPIDLTVNDFVLLKESAIDNEELSSISGTINYQYEEFPLTFNYKMRSVFSKNLTSFTVPGRATYQNVKEIKVIVNLEISTVMGMFPISVLHPQDIVVSTQYYANNIGMIYSNTDISYSLASDQIDVGVPTSGSQNIKEFLVSYNTSVSGN